MRRIQCAGCLGILGIVLLILGGLVAGLFDDFINQIIYKELVIRSGSDMYQTWKHPPVVPHLRMYFFNLTNKQEFLDGAKPVLQEVGPYCYREHWEKINIGFHNNGTVSYETQKHYYFERSHSSGSEDDVIVTLNIPMLAAVSQVRFKPRLAQLAIDSLLTVLKEQPIVAHTVGEFMWGYDDPLLKIAKNLLPPEERMPFDKFGFFINRNGSTDGLFNVFTGEGDITRYTTINTFNHKKYLDFWKTEECNMINGTDGSSFPPGVTEDSLLYMFNENLCRSIPLTFWHSKETFGMKALRFSPPRNVFDVTPENDCYCVGGPPCLGGGVFNISTCKFGSPTVVSWPHFYQADRKYREAVVGMKPDPEKHAMYIDVSPRTGSPLSAEARLQINVAVPHVPVIKPAAMLREMIFPVVWFEDGVTELPSEIVELLQVAENVPEVTKSSLLVAFFVLGGVLVLGVSLSLLAEHFDLPLPFLNPNYNSSKSAKDKASDRPQGNSPKRELSGHSNPAMTDDGDKDAA